MRRKRNNSVGVPNPENHLSETPEKKPPSDPAAAVKSAMNDCLAAKARLESATREAVSVKYATGEEVERVAARLLELGISVQGLAHHNPDHVGAVFSAFHNHYGMFRSGGKLIDTGTINTGLEKLAQEEGWQAPLSTAIRAYCLAVDRDSSAHFLGDVLARYQRKSVRVPLSLVQFCREQDCRLLSGLWAAKAVTPEDVAKDLTSLARSNLGAALQAARGLAGEPLSKLDLSKILGLDRDDDGRRAGPRSPDVVSQRLLEVLVDNPNISGRDAAASVLADRILASNDMDLLVSFARSFRTVKASEIRAAIVKAVSGPPVDDIVDAIIDRGYHPHPFSMYRMMYSPWFYGLGRYG